MLSINERNIMLRVNREELLKALESVSPGLAAREIIEQSSCFVFENGRVFTFNDEVSCSRKSPLEIAGAVKAAPLLELLTKLTEEYIEIGKVNSELRVKGSEGRKSLLRMEELVMLPIESIEPPEDWKPLHVDFSEAVSIVHSCASGEESQFVLTCIHIHPDFLEACDGSQIARYALETGVETPMLIRADSLRKILGLDMTEMSETESWVHFRNPAGLVLSCRRYLDEYKTLDRFISKDGLAPFTLPGGLEEVVSRAEIFSSENILGNNLEVDLSPDRIVVKGEGAYGWHKEMKKTKYAGDPIRFMIAPKLLVELTKKANECGVTEGRLFIDGGKFVFACSTEQIKEEI